MKRPILVLVDGHAVAYRQFFALPVQGFATKSGELTNASYGFARTLLDILDTKPDYLAVTFDQGMSGRDQLYGEYKGTREKMDEGLRSQLNRIRELVLAFNIPILEMEGYEADDVIGTVAQQAEAQGADVFIITGDRDILQLITDHTSVQLPGKKREDSVRVYDLARFREEYQFEPPHLVDLKGFMGDHSDNIPGVDGIGEKTAATLIQTYGSVDGVYEHLDEIKGKLRERLETGREMAFLSQTLARIRRDVPVSIELEKCVAQDYRYEDVEKLFRELEFRSLITRLPGRPAAPSVAGSSGSRESHQLSMFEMQQETAAAHEIEIVVPYEIVDDAAKLAALVDRLNHAESISFDTEGTGLDKMQLALVGISLAVDGETGYYIPVGHVAANAPAVLDVEQPDLIDGHSPRQLPIQMVMDAIRPALTNPKIPKYAHNAGFDLVVMRRYGIDVQPITFDTMIAESVRDPTSRNLGLKNLAWVELGVQMTHIEELIGKGKTQTTMDRVAVEQCAPYAAADAVFTRRLVDVLRPDLEGRLEKLFNEIEMPLVPVIADMEMAGVLLDVPYLRGLSKDLNARCQNLAEEIYGLSGGYGAFNLGSPKQLNDVLFGKLGLSTEGLRKTTHGLSTDADTLAALKNEHPIVPLILQWRELSKLQSTYVDALPQLVNPQTGRVHTSFNQTGTATGRVSSNNPNLQNIPIRTDEGRRVRQAFIVPEGCRLLSVDYSQVELRILAHYSDDEGLLDAFRRGVDIHRATAAAVNHIPLEAVTREQRSFAKSVNFGLMYGMGAFRLARESNLTLAEAERFITDYFQQFPGVRAYLDQSLEQVKAQGYIETLFGRRRKFPVFQSTSKASYQDRQRAEREAINMPIQGTAADIMKIAMIDLAKRLPDVCPKAKLLLQVHDELVLEVPEDDIERVAAEVVQTMEAAFDLKAPLRADAKVGLNWAEMEAM
ncbi:MAG TPA: DNA polymerase I [Aggregatilineaceae bacterium]|nr:DNA polymerase I [Aggregatilineaceae bacterium]